MPKPVIKSQVKADGEITRESLDQMSDEELAALDAKLDADIKAAEDEAYKHVFEMVGAIEEAMNVLNEPSDEEGKGGPGSGRRPSSNRNPEVRRSRSRALIEASNQRLIASMKKGAAVKKGLESRAKNIAQSELVKSLMKARREERRAGSRRSFIDTQAKSAKELKEFIETVKSAVDRELDKEVTAAVCSYFIETKEPTMTKEQLIALLKSKSVSAAAPIPSAPEAKADGEAAPAEQQPSGDPMEMMKEIMAKLDAIAQGLAQVLEGAKPAEEAQPEEGKAEDKPAEAPAPESDEEEMSEEEMEKQLAEIQADIDLLEDSDDV